MSADPGGDYCLWIEEIITEERVPESGARGLPQPAGVRSSRTMSEPDVALRTIERNPQIIESSVKTVDNAVNEVGQTAQEALGPNGPLSQTLQQATQQVGQQLGQSTQQLAQSSGTVAGGGVGGLGGVPGGSRAHAAWQRMKKIVNSSQPLRQVTTWLAGPQGQQPPS
ncbi:hypothetical protein ABZU25_07205 [Micromonospora sp. NPDC005215]|uniref:hypothetical protein n=1 Tax=Micromonospora sp. NPDC005215 TaxID=3157024 RepID=UPI0033A527A4